MKRFIIQEDDANQTIFKFLKKVYSTTPLSVIYKWFRKKSVKLNGTKISNKKIVLQLNDEVIVYDQNETQQRVIVEGVDFGDLDVVYEDDNLLIVNKPFNMEIHTSYNISLDQMVRAYLVAKKEYFPEKMQSFVVSHIHRLDKLTTGLVIYAKNKVALEILLTAIQDKQAIEKYYVCRTKPGFPESLAAKGWIFYDQNLKKSVYQDKIIDSNDYLKTAITNFKLLETNQDYSLVEAQLETGRKHQIRATLSFYDFPILNDFKYGGKRTTQEKMIFLKAYKLVFKNLAIPLNYLNGLVVEIGTNFNN